MAQALFDEHPLEDYLRDAGESSVTMPGITFELEREIDPYVDRVDDSPEDALTDWLPQYAVEFIEFLQSAISSAQSPNKASSYVERFKYNIITSSLLAPSLPTSHARRPSRTLSIPGQHSATPSEDLDRPTSTSSSPLPVNTSDLSYGPISFSIASLAISLSIGYPFLALLSAMGVLFFLYHLIYTIEVSNYDMIFPFNALDDLITTNNMWEATVQEAVTFLEREERTHVLGFSGPSSPSPLRVALLSCLQATQSQCDNIRQLFMALTSPTNLSQISEMYAPASPTKSIFEIHSASFAFPSPHRPSTTPTTPQNKRSTWNGSYSTLGYTNSPPSFSSRRRDRHRMNISEVFQSGTSSAPTTPFLPPPLASLSQVPEHSTMEGLPSSDSNLFSGSSHFGAAALDLQRKRRSGGMEVLSQSRSDVFSDLKSPRSARNTLFSSTITSPSKFTTTQSSRHPLSYSALNISLQGALAAKRYTCSHLLALRFEDDEDDGYWEDVRSVMGLLTSSLTDGFSRLSAALDEVEQQKLQDQHPTPETSVSHLDFSGSDDFSPSINLDSEIKRRKHESKTSFAPMPTHVSRFAAHVAAIGSALDDARENLEQCVAALKSDPSSSPTIGSSRQLRHSRSRSRMMASPAGEEAEAEVEESPALQAYERLRRELGMALRECERGRERLLELVNPTVPSDDDEEDDEFDDLPGLGHDGSEDSDKPEANSPSSGDEDDLQSNAARFQPSVVTVEGVSSVDDATSHLLLATSTQHLPMPGIEEVFEADTGAKIAFNRERSKLSREERIKLAKARRESGMGLVLGVAGEGQGEEEPVKLGVEKWGPGGDVVQELKDVIWKVGERKRKMADSSLSPSHATPFSTPESK